jgi:hypothetical protein
LCYLRQRNSEKAPKIFIFVEVSRCRYLDRRSIEPSPTVGTEVPYLMIGYRLIFKSIPLFTLLCFKTSVLSLSHTNPVLSHINLVLSHTNPVLYHTNPVLSHFSPVYLTVPLSCPVLPLSRPDHLRAGVYHLAGMVCTPRRSCNQLPISAVWRDSLTLLKVVFVFNLKHQ